MGVTSSLRGEKSTSEQHFRQGLKLAKRHRRCGIIGANCELALAGLLLGGGPTDLGKPGGTGEASGLPLPNQEEEALELLRSVRNILCFRIRSSVSIYVLLVSLVTRNDSSSAVLLLYIRATNQ